VTEHLRALCVVEALDVRDNHLDGRHVEGL
jgi:hypothetical protein